jgi:hypothetical protein
MFEELRRKYAHFIIKRKYLRKSNEPIDFKTAISGTKDVLVIMPGLETDFSASLEIIEYLQIHKKEVTLFISELKHEAIQSKQNSKFLSFHPTQISWFFLPDKKLLARLAEKRFDAVIDLNRKEDTFFSCIANAVQSGIRVGFRKNNSDGYYNLLYESKQSEPAVAYSKFLEHLSMF